MVALARLLHLEGAIGRQKKPENRHSDKGTSRSAQSAQQHRAYRRDFVGSGHETHSSGSWAQSVKSEGRSEGTDPRTMVVHAGVEDDTQYPPDTPPLRGLGCFGLAWLSKV